MSAPTPERPAATDIEAIARWADRRGASGAVELVGAPDHPLYARLEAFFGRLQDAAPGLALRREEDPRAPGPGLRPAPNLAFHLLPAGPELSLFLEALDQAADPPEPPRLLDRIGLPAHLRLFVGPGCPVCPAMVRRLVPLALSASRLHLRVIDAAAFPNLAQKQSVRATPTLILDGRFRWTGTVALTELLPAIADRDPARLGPAALETLLGEGGADRLAEMMVAAGRPFDALAELLASERWPVRLGAMVAVEALVARRPRLAAAMVPDLLSRYAAVPANVRGDLLYVLGQIATPAHRDTIASLTADETDAEVREAAAEALAALRPPRPNP